MATCPLQPRHVPRLLEQHKPPVSSLPFYQSILHLEFLSFHLAPTAFELPKAYHCPHQSPDHSSPRTALCHLHNSAVFRSTSSLCVPGWSLQSTSPTAPSFLPHVLWASFVYAVLSTWNATNELCLYCLNAYTHSHTLSYPLAPYKAFPDLLRAPQHFLRSLPCSIRPVKANVNDPLLWAMLYTRFFSFFHFILTANL